MREEIRKEDYEEPRCLLDMNRESIAAIPVGRVIEKLDVYLSRNDHAAAERHLKYWQEEAEAGNDLRGKLAVLNEEIGLYRKIPKETECMAAIEAALELVRELEMQDSVTGGTIFVNAATGYEAFGYPEKALPLYEKAKEVYEKTLDTKDSRLGGLYNNMALCLTALERYGEARKLFSQALSVMEQQTHREPEMAITYLNLCDLVDAEEGAERGEEKISAYLQKAEDLLYTEGLPRDGNYAFICEKCASVFGFYGWFLTEKELMRRSEEIRNLLRQ